MTIIPTVNCVTDVRIYCYCGCEMPVKGKCPSCMGRWEGKRKLNKKRKLIFKLPHGHLSAANENRVVHGTEEHELRTAHHYLAGLFGGHRAWDHIPTRGKKKETMWPSQLKVCSVSHSTASSFIHQAVCSALGTLGRADTTLPPHPQNSLLAKETDKDTSSFLKVMSHNLSSSESGNVEMEAQRLLCSCCRHWMLYLSPVYLPCRRAFRPSPNLCTFLLHICLIIPVIAI